ncbi:N-acetylglucosaminidase [Neobacillus sp. K501]
MGKKKLGFSSLVLSLVLSGVIFSPKTTSALTDFSMHRVETGGIAGEKNVKSAIDRISADTGWWATYEPLGTYVPYYQVFSGGFYGEENVKDKLGQFQSKTGLSASYLPVGNQEPYQQIFTGGFYGEENAKRIAQDFSTITGIPASYEPTGQGKNKMQITSGGFYGVENVKRVLEEFQQTTGISATYEQTGQTEDYYKVLSGGFSGEDNVKAILQDFIASTGINASYEPVQYIETNSIVTGGFGGEANVQAIVSQIMTDTGLQATYEPTDVADIFRIKISQLYGDSLKLATNYMNQKGWWYYTTPSNYKIPTLYRIVSDPILKGDTLNKALNFYANHNWWATANLTGTKGSPYFRVVSSSLMDEAIISKGLNFFSSRNWWATTQLSNEKFYPFYRVVTGPVLEKDKLNIAMNYFKTNGWWYSTQYTGNYGYTMFQIKSNPLLAHESEKALNFFTTNGWWASSNPTGLTEPVFKIVTGAFQGYENALASAKKLSELYGWYTNTVLVKSGPQVSYTNYNLTLEEMLNLQMKQSPQTDKYRNEPAYVHSAYVDVVNNKITTNGLNVRSGPGTNYSIVAQLSNGFTGFRILATEGEWYKISLTWRNAKSEDVAYYLNPNNFPSDSIQYFQFLKLSKPAGINVNEVNEKILNNNAGILKGTAETFVKAAQLYNINELYLISHSLLETGYGSSSLAKGISYNGKVVYNMYGYGAYDSCPETCGAQTAYEQGWFTPELAIIGGASLIGKGYIYNETFQQDTIYKMRWNPIVTYHQYATDIAWASKQVTNIYNLYKLLDNYTLYTDLPVYKK